MLGFKVGGRGRGRGEGGSEVDCFNPKGTFFSILTLNNFSDALSQENS